MLVTLAQWVVLLGVIVYALSFVHLQTGYRRHDAWVGGLGAAAVIAAFVIAASGANKFYTLLVVPGLLGVVEVVVWVRFWRGVGG